MVTESTAWAWGHLRVEKVFADGRRQEVCNKRNQLTYGYLDKLVELIAQRTPPTDADPSENQVFSLWFEASTLSISDPTPNDTEPDANSTIVEQKVFADIDKLSSVSGDTRSLELRATLETDEGLGSSIVAVDLFTKGTLASPPDPLSYTGGDDNVNLIARQKIGPIPKTDDFALDINWTLSFRIVSA